MWNDKRTCALEGCNNTFVPKCPRQTHCCTTHSHITQHAQNDAKCKNRNKGWQLKNLKLHNGIEVANNIISKGVLSA